MHNIINLFFITLLFITITKAMLCFYLKNKYMKIYIKDTLLYEKRIKRELLIIYSYYIKNKSIKLSRRFISSTQYDKNKKSNTAYDKRCKVMSKFKKIPNTILVAIHCHISLFYQRFVIRQTYKIYKNIQLLFFIGLSNNHTVNSILHEEMNIYSDIILFYFYSNYNNLKYFTYNFILWVKKYKYLYDIIIKQDTDTFLNIKLLQKIIINHIKNETNYVLGYIWNYNNKKSEYPSGMAYIFSSQSLDILTENIDKKYSKLYYCSAEDKFFGYLARKANFSFYDSYKNFHFKSYLQIPDDTNNINNIFMIHSLRISEISFFNYITSNKTSLIYRRLKRLI